MRKLSVTLLVVLAMSAITVPGVSADPGTEAEQCGPSTPEACVPSDLGCVGDALFGTPCTDGPLWGCLWGDACDNVWGCLDGTQQCGPSETPCIDNPSPCNAGEDCIDDLGGGGNTACSTPADTAERCQQGLFAPCEPAVECGNDLSTGSRDGPCGAAAGTAEDCESGTTGSPCAPVHACAAGDPTVPCNPDPTFTAPELSECVSSCDTTWVQRPVVVATDQPVPQLYLVICFVPVPDPLNGGEVGVPVPMLDQEGTCPNGWASEGDPQPLMPFETQPDPRFEDAIPIYHGTCLLSWGGTVYGQPFGGAIPVPCATAG